MSELNQHIFEYAIRIGDTGLVLSQRLGEWCGHGPILEEDIALTNISLDLIGQARNFLTYAAQVENAGRDEDKLAFFRDTREYRNTLLAELPNGDFAQTILRQFFISNFQFYFFEELKSSSDKMFSALAEKSLKETSYHLRHCSQWVIRLGDGTEESHFRLSNALDELWRYTGDLFIMNATDQYLIEKRIAVDLEKIKESWIKKTGEVFSSSRLEVPADTFMITGGIEGKHTEYLGHMLAEMQVLPRSFPGVEW
jgi:ring-1,2-phenylacetyl-CoA epoxidase subunit PaaC